MEFSGHSQPWYRRGGAWFLAALTIYPQLPFRGPCRQHMLAYVFKSNRQQPNAELHIDSYYERAKMVTFTIADRARNTVNETEWIVQSLSTNVLGRTECESRMYSWAAAIHSVRMV